MASDDKLPRLEPGFELEHCAGFTRDLADLIAAQEQVIDGSPIGGIADRESGKATLPRLVRLADDERSR
jgi:hypothetical protein